MKKLNHNVFKIMYALGSSWFLEPLMCLVTANILVL